MRRIGIIGGMSWESTAVYYQLLNRQYAAVHGAWAQPPVVIDSIDFAELAGLQRAGDWNACADMLVASAQRLVAADCQVIGIAANTMHVVAEQVRDAIGSALLVDIVDVVADAVRARGGSSVGLLGTRYTMELDFYSEGLRAKGLDVVLPDAAQRDELQRIVYEELTQGKFSPESRAALESIAASCIDRGAAVSALCCTEFGILLDPATSTVPLIDSTPLHVSALLQAAAAL